MLAWIYLQYPTAQSSSQDSSVHTETALKVTKSTTKLPAGSSVLVCYLTMLANPEIT
jgi:hypothetical protein